MAHRVQDGERRVEGRIIAIPAGFVPGIRVNRSRFQRTPWPTLTRARSRDIRGNLACDNYFMDHETLKSDGCRPGQRHPA